MNRNKIKDCLGHRMQLVPSPLYLDADGDRIPLGEEFWTVKALPPEHVELENDNGVSCRLGYDHIHNYATDPQRSSFEQQYGMLVLNMQLVVRDGDIKFHPTRPGVPFDPPGTTKEERARIHFTPEVQRLIQQRIYVLSRCVVNFLQTSHGKPSLPDDSWSALQPGRSVLYPRSPLIADLSNGDVYRLAEFYGSIQSHAATIEQWARDDEPHTFNHWNVLLQSVADSLRKAQTVVEKFCPERSYHANMPAAGTLSTRIATALTQADDDFRAHIALGYAPPVAAFRPTRQRR